MDPHRQGLQGGSVSIQKPPIEPCIRFGHATLLLIESNPDKSARKGIRMNTDRMIAVSQVFCYSLLMSSLVKQIRASINSSDQTRYQISKGSGVAQSQLSRLMSEEHGISIANAERVAAYLGLEIIIRPKRGRRKA